MTTSNVSGFPFQLIDEITPEKDCSGKVIEYFPQKRYEKAESTNLHKYGKGPFCEFRIGNLQTESGVYLLSIDNKIKYIGECVNFEERWGPRGYASIQPRNCFVGGQSTNCKINNLILTEYLRGGKLQLWFYKTQDYKAIERQLISKYKPDWNILLK